jgi:exonuclease SbcC
VRPLTLRVRGLRSYLVERSVDFSELGLVAIIGPTGAGKSSLLEAMTYALYGGCTWDQRGGKALIADTAKTMTVQLTFEAAGKSWEVTRTTSQGAYPPPSFGLVCLTDPDEPKVDGEDAVNRRVAELVGLDFHSFCSCVLLPQGRFEALLKARPARRAEILEHIFGVDELTDLREQVGTVMATVRDRRAAIAEQRAKFLYDPREEMTQARARLEELEPACEALGQDVEQVVALRELATERQDELERLKRRILELEELRDGPLERLQDLAARAGELASVRARLAEDLKHASSADEQARQHELAARAERRDLASVASAQTALEATRGELEAIATAEVDLASDNAAVARDRITHQTQAAELDERKQVAEEAGTALLQAHERLATEKTAAETLDYHHTALREALDEHNTRAEELETARQRAQDAAREHQDAEKGARDADELARRREQELTTLRHAHAVADLAGDCRPGDPCPVCEQTLPNDFAVEPVADLAAGLDSVQRSKQAATDAQRQAAALEATSQAAKDTLKQAAARLADAATIVQTKGRAASDVLPLGDLDAQAALKELNRRSEAGDARLESLGQAYEQAQREAQTAREAHETLRDAHGRQEVALAERTRALAQRREELARRRDNVPQRLADLPVWAHPRAVLNEAITEALREVEQAQLDAQAVAQRRESSQQALTSAREALDEHDRHARREVSEPAMAERETLRALTRELGRDGVGSLDEPPTPTVSIPQLLAWGQALGARAEHHGDTLRQRAEQAATQVQKATGDGTTILERRGAANARALEQRLRELDAQRFAARDAHRRASAQIDGADTLDSLKRQAADLEQALQELHELLTRGRFIGHVISVRQRALLILASGLMGQVTGGRFGFTSDFQVVDTRSGLARKPETLSGGETFLASLALALGLVELMGRAGGQLRALFLDEGFGSLDPNALDEALDALETRARAGQLIAIISHVPAVAERIESVLQVVPRPEGSEVIPLDATARQRLAEQEAEDLALT